MRQELRAIPVEGGFFRWIGMAFGEFWGFLAGWGCWVKMLADTAIYPILFSQYMKYWLPDLEALHEKLIRAGIIWLFVAINLRGIRAGGQLVIVFTILEARATAARPPGGSPA